MDEAGVKAAILSHVRSASGRRKKPIVTAEFSLGSRGVRADLAIFSDEVIGIEIKTERDSLRRLSNQMEAYASYFERVIAIVAPRHVVHVKSEHLFGASLWTYDAGGAFEVVRPGSSNRVAVSALRDAMTKQECAHGDFNAAMAKRYAGTSERFWAAVARRKIQPQDLALLSRFADARKEARRFAEAREARWSAWLEAQPSL